MPQKIGTFMACFMTRYFLIHLNTNSIDFVHLFFCLFLKIQTLMKLLWSPSAYLVWMRKTKLFSTSKQPSLLEFIWNCSKDETQRQIQFNFCRRQFSVCGLVKPNCLLTNLKCLISVDTVWCLHLFSFHYIWSLRMLTNKNFVKYWQTIIKEN